MGIELDVLVGHPGHDLLFVATQVARAAGLKNPSAVITNQRITYGVEKGLIQWKGLLRVYSETVGHTEIIPNTPGSRVLQAPCGPWMS